MTNFSSAAPGWYHGIGDPPGTERWWDGNQWMTAPCLFDEAGRCTVLRAQLPLRDRVRASIDFSGRSTRREFWRFVAPLLLLVVGLYFAGALLADFGQGNQVQLGFALLITSAIVAVVGLVPGIAASVRRLHDTDHSGWWITLALIPGINYIGLPVLLYLLTRPSARNPMLASNY